jgi:hypothetical protein
MTERDAALESIPCEDGALDRSREPLLIARMSTHRFGFAFFFSFATRDTGRGGG